MQSFRVLDRNQNVHKNHLLEASAGTGKTFSIENIIVRLLIENDPLTIEQILVVTFTRAATRDLKVRIHENIMDSINILKKAKNGSQYISSNTIDYILKVIEEGSDSIAKALKNLERAICSFDLSQIYTIHSFCAQMISENVFESNINLSLSDTEESVSNYKLKSVVRDFFRSGSLQEKYSKAQLKLLLKMHYGDLSRLENSILNITAKGVDIVEFPDYEKLLHNFNETMMMLKTKYHFTSEKIIEDFLSQAPLYTGNCDKKGNIKPEYVERIKEFASLFDKELWGPSDLDWLIEDQLYILQALDESKLKKKAQPENCDSIQIPFLNEIIKKHLQEYVSTNIILSRIARDCQIVLNAYKDKEECFGYDDFLKGMRNALNNSTFQDKVRSKYKAAIIDEFQDTDPLQWEIFHNLFLSKMPSQCILYLVGDPKQSIYAFRQADIYTYMLAAEQIGKENHYSLDTNFRAQPPLTDALNTLFCEKSSPNMLYLPKIDAAMHYPLVKSPESADVRTFTDSKGTVHFFIAEDKKSKSYPMERLEGEYFLPFIVQEILYLVDDENFKFNDIAILVADHKQAARTLEFLKIWNIPVSTQKAASLIKTAAFPSMRELLLAVLNPKDESALKVALGGKIIRWNHDEIKTLEDPNIIEGILYKLFSLREDIFTDGFATFFQKFLRVSWKDDGYSVIERLLLEEDSEEFLHDLQQVADLLLEHETSHRGSVESLVKHLDELQSLGDSDDVNAKKISDPTKNAVQIMTLHASKGLEFDIVFTLGLVKRIKFTESMIPVEKESKRYLSPVVDHSSDDYQKYCQELDTEKIRQLYVAMTRAKYRLYNPIIHAPAATKFEKGQASPMDLFLARLGQEPIEQSKLYSRIKGYNIQLFTDFIDTLEPKPSITYSLLNDATFSLKKYTTEESISIVQPPAITIPGVERFIQSFTTLSSTLGKHKKDNTLQPPHNFGEQNKTPHTLPAGSETGNLLHNCLEALSFENCIEMTSPSDLENIIRPQTSGTEYEEWLHVICEMIFNALKTPLNRNFSLCEVTSENCYKEGEFLYESTLKNSPGYIKGFVDLFFFHNGKYYLLDWKTNWLGENIQAYDRENLQKAMEDNGYFLQASLYCEAIKKYLKLVDKRPFEEIFGGIYYIFLRGLNRNSDAGYGVFDFNIEE